MKNETRRSKKTEGPHPLIKPAVRARRVLAGDGEASVELSVYCPKRERSESLDVCATCKHIWLIPADAGGGKSAIECAPPLESPKPPPGGKRHPTVDTREAALRTQLHAVMGREVACVRDDASLDVVRAMLVDSALRCVPVVDAEHRLLGIVAKSDVLRDEQDRGDTTESEAPRNLGAGFHVEELASRLAREVMTPEVHALPEDAPLAYAISLMAIEKVHEVPVVDADAKLVGVVTALDVMTWVARQLGYALPEGT
jgi:CBS domain-containing protein